MRGKSLLLAAFALWQLLLRTAVPAQQPLLVIEATAEHPRNSEGAILPLKDGRLCLIYTRFTGGTADDAAADLAMRISGDQGQTWSEDQIVVKNQGRGNVMSVSLLRLADGRVALFYLRKQSLEDCRPVLQISNDEAATFGQPTLCITDEVGYYVMNNDRAVQLKGGRIVLPVALHNKPGQEKPDWAGRAMCYLSDDGGKTWRRSKTTLVGQSADGKRVMVQEPGVVELTDGQLMMYCRTDGGSQFVSHSADGGETWSELAPSQLASPRSPASIERIPWSRELVCVWNDHSGVHPFTESIRSPLCLAVSRDEGKTWSRSQAIESDPNGCFCYTAITFVGDRMLLAYSGGNEGLNRLKVVAVSKDSLDKCAAAGPARPASEAFAQPCLDYGRSFINAKASWNSPRFWVESRCRVTDAGGKSVEFLQCGLCRSERTFAYRALFTEDNYDFLPVFAETQAVIFRRYTSVGRPYRDVRSVEASWGGVEPRLSTQQARVLATPDEIFQAMQEGKPIIGQTQLRDEQTGQVAVIEYPIKTINFERNRKDWQVDTGPVILPDLSVPPEQWPHTIQLAHIAFRTPYWADFLVDQPTAIPAADSSGEPLPLDSQAEAHRSYHYSGQVHKRALNVLLSLEN